RPSRPSPRSPTSIRSLGLPRPGPTLNGEARSAWSGGRDENVCHYIPSFWVEPAAGLGDSGFGPAGGVDAEGGEDGGLEWVGSSDHFDGPVAGGEGDRADPVEFS